MADTHTTLGECKCSNCTDNRNKSTTIDARHYMFRCPQERKMTADGEEVVTDYALICKTTNKGLKFACSCELPVGQCVFETERSRMGGCFFCRRSFA